MINRVFSPILIILFLSAALPSVAQEILVKNDGYYTEVFLKVPPQELSAIRQSDTSVIVEFSRPLTNKFDRSVDKLIVSVRGEGRRMVVRFSPEADFAVFSDPEGLRFVAAVQKQLEDTLPTYGIGAPMLRKDAYYFDDPVSEALIQEAQNLASMGRFYEAQQKLNTVIYSDAINFYKQEALFNQGLIYMEQGKLDPGAYFDASISFDYFLTEFPDSTRVPQVHLLNADVKRLSGQLNDAAASYRQVYQTGVDTATKRRALLAMGEIYTQLGHYQEAINAYQEYMNNFRTGREDITGRIASLLLQAGKHDEAQKLLAKMSPGQIAEMLDSPGLIRIAEAYISTGDNASAVYIYKHMMNNNYTETPEAMYRYANMLRAEDPREASDILEALSERYPNNEYGLKGLVEFAELNYASKTADAWMARLAPVFQGEDFYDLRPRAQMVRIKAMYKDNETADIISMIDTYIAEYSTSPNLPFLLGVKEDVLYASGRAEHEKENYQRAVDYYNKLLELFPDTVMKKEVMTYLDDAKYNLALGLYNSEAYDKVVSEVETRFREETPASARWTDLWDDALYGYLRTANAEVPERILRYKARDYLSNLPNGKHKADVGAILYNSFDKAFSAAETDNLSSGVIALYDENRGWLTGYADQTYANRVAIRAANALAHMGMLDSANRLYNDITPMISPEYAALSYALCKPPTFFDINRLTGAEFRELRLEVERNCTAEYAYNLIKQYTVEPAAALAARYETVKRVNTPMERSRLLTDIYNELEQSPGTRFSGYEQVYLDLGLDAYRKNNYQGAITTLKRFTEISYSTGEDMAQALYYLGKALTMINDHSLAAGYYNRLVNEMPDSIYKSMARSELEDDAWRKSLPKR